MPSFWVDPADVSADELMLRGTEAHHLRKVRRIRTGDRVWVVDGCGMRYEVTVVSFDVDTARCTISQRWKDWGESAVRLCLVPALIKGQLFDEIIEKATEVGVDSIRPLVAARSVVRPDSAAKVERWRRVARAAVKQCGRSRMPAVHMPAKLPQVLKALQDECRQLVMAAPDATGEPLELVLGCLPSRPLALFVGPEGGFVPEERLAVEAAGGVAFSWGSRILRVETACAVLSALVMHQAALRGATV